jgi:hypothetical protein
VKRFVGPLAIAILLAGLLPASVLAATLPKFTVQPVGGTSGVAWSQQPQVTIMTGNTIETGAIGSITLSRKAGTGPAAAVLSCAALTVPLVNGVAVFTGCSIDLAGNGYRLVATWSQGGSTDSASFSIAGIGNATKLAFIVQPGNGTPGVALAPQPSVAVQNANGGSPTGTSPVAVTLALGANPGGATLTCTGGLTKTTQNNVAAFNGCKLDKLGVGYTLIATATGLTQAQSAPFTIGGGPATKLVFTAQPGASTALQAFATQPVVAITDAGGNVVTTGAASTKDVTLSLGVNPGGGALTCTGGLSKVAVAGVATFAGCSINKAGVGYTIVATSNGLTKATSAPFTVVATAAAITLTNSASVITWGGTVVLSVQFGPNGANRTFNLEGARDGVTWTTRATLTTNAAGQATFPYRPAINAYYRAVFAGAPDLAAATSNITRTTVRQIALLRPTNLGAIKSVARNTSITFTTTARPARPELPPVKVTFVFYYRVKVQFHWDRVAKRDVIINSLGKASTTFKFTRSGNWYVRTIANPTPYNANSVWSPLERYRVR